MNALVRWGRFNLVGAMGMVVQLGALSCFNRLLAGHYLYVSAIAVEFALLHNFAWHWHFTWRDRREGVKPLRPLVRFHLSNGLVSMLGNLASMRVLTHHWHLPLLLANGIAILCCSVANFLIGDRWAFARAQRGPACPAAASIPPVHSSHQHSFVSRGIRAPAYRRCRSVHCRPLARANAEALAGDASDLARR